MWTVGIDEAGRGPLAGPVTVGVFAMNMHVDSQVLSGIKDSKQLRPSERDLWYAHLTTLEHTRWAVAHTSAAIIDRIGIQRAIMQALTRALNKTQVPYDARILLDGSLHAPQMYANQTTIIRGDVLEPIISAASILAKVTRDRHLERLDVLYPVYGFAQHKGYGTVHHRNMVRQHGVSPLHRTTFCTRV